MWMRLYRNKLCMEVLNFSMTSDRRTDGMTRTVRDPSAR